MVIFVLLLEIWYIQGPFPGNPISSCLKYAEFRRESKQVSSAQPATMVLPSLADNPSQMAPQGSPAPVEAPGNVVLPIPSVHDTLGVNVSYSNREKIINGQYLDLGCLLEN